MHKRKFRVPCWWSGSDENWEVEFLAQSIRYLTQSYKQPAKCLTTFHTNKQTHVQMEYPSHLWAELIAQIIAKWNWETHTMFFKWVFKHLAVKILYIVACSNLSHLLFHLPLTSVCYVKVIVFYLPWLNILLDPFHWYWYMDGYVWFLLMWHT